MAFLMARDMEMGEETMRQVGGGYRSVTAVVR